MDDIHISRELYQAVERGELPGHLLEEIQAEHLLARCPHCRAEAEAYSLGRRAGPSTWSRLLQSLSLLIPRWMAPAERELRGARRDFEEILSLPVEARAGRLARARSRFRSPDLVRLLLDESRRHLPGESSEAFHFAELARKVANRNPGMPEFYELYVLTTVAMANACRVRNEASRKEGRAADVQRLAEEMLPIFQAQDVNREALAAFRLFQEAARRQELTVEQARAVAEWLRRSPNPGTHLGSTSYAALSD
jgi:hypothetical protein